MTGNPMPDDDDILSALAGDMADGCHALEVTIGIKQNTEVVLRAAILAVNNAKNALGTANATAIAKTALGVAADVAGETVIKNCRLRLVKLYGGQYNANWQTAGFPDESTAVPGSMDKRYSLLGLLVIFFTNTPSAESADMEATAAICTAAHTALSTARSASNAAKTALETAKDNRTAALKTLRRRVHGLIEELGTILADDDNRYETFGLNVPANPSPPEQIASLTLTAMGGGKVFVQWLYSTRMAGTRLLLQKVGVDDDFISAGTFDGLEKMLTGFSAGLTVKAKVIAYNDGGDAPESPVAQVVVT